MLPKIKMPGLVDRAFAVKTGAQRQTERGFCATLLRMADPAPVLEVVQQVHPVWFDWITVAAIVLGPVFALFAQRALDLLREKKKRRVALYETAMAYRGMWLHPDSIRALNSIDAIFDRPSDSKVRNAWVAVLDQARTPIPENDNDGQKEWNNRLLDRRIDLYQLLGAAVGYDHTIDCIKNQCYTPRYYENVEIEQMLIRQGLVKIITDRGLKVTVIN